MQDTETRMEEINGSLTFRWLAPEYAVAPQLDPAGATELMAHGFRSVINIRHDGEQNQSITSVEAAKLVTSHGLTYVHMPVRGGLITAEEKVNTFEAAIDQAPKPVLVYCETGARAAILWAFSSVKRMPAADVLATCNRAGYDLSFFTEQLRERRRAHVAAHGGFLRRLAGFLRLAS
jgi:sulfide:quinone oxidoreductase